MRQIRLKTMLPIVLLVLIGLAGCSTEQAMRMEGTSSAALEGVKAGQFDTGRMWTFDYPPVEYFRKTYRFNPTAEWFEKARLSALRLPGCSASFVSEDGLVITNHHCARGALDRVNKEGENLPDDGFFAATLEEERKIPNYYADQLMLMEDVTAEVQAAFERGMNDEERIANRNAAIAQIQSRYQDETGYTCSVYTFFNGGKYALYGFKRYNDVRLVFAPEQKIAFFGGDPDNFTYPRYDVDFAIYRVYDDDGNPLKTKNFFRWSTTGAGEGDAVFVIGNPGSTRRLLTVAQLEYNRDYSYDRTVKALEEAVEIYAGLIKQHPEKRLEYQTTLFGYENALKVYRGRIKGLHDPVIMAKKQDFEQSLMNEVKSRPSLQSQYGNSWTEIAMIQKQKAKIYEKDVALRFSGLGRSRVLGLAENVIEFARTAKMPDADRPENMRGDGLENRKGRLARTEIDAGLDEQLLAGQLSFMVEVLGSNDQALAALLKGQAPAAAAKRLMGETVLTKKEDVEALLDKTPDEILASTDPLLVFIRQIDAEASAVHAQYAELLDLESANVQRLGKAIFEVYGTSIPPDATFSLRIADGVVKNYEYNGTIAPVNTTFYGMYDRYYSFGMKDPWELPARWTNPPKEFDLRTPLNFVSTNDIIGGNSGSPVVNKDLEFCGIAFDGNIESMPGDYIFDETANRCVSVHSAGILEALKDLYKADRIAKELVAGKIVK